MNFLKVIAFSLAFLASTQLSQKDHLNAQPMKSQFAYVRHFSGVYPGLHQASSLATDSKGNIYLAGYIGSKIDLDPDTGSMIVDVKNNTFDIVVVKLNKNGQLINAMSIGGDSLDEALSICVDDNDNFYISGYFSRVVDFDPGKDTFELTTKGNTDAFVAKYDSAFNFIWANQIGGKKADRANAISCNGNKLIVTGFYWDSLKMMVNNQLMTLPISGFTDAFIARFDLSGAALNLLKLGSSGYEQGVTVKCNSKKSVFIGGFFGGSMDANPGNSSYSISNQGSNDIYLLCLDSNMNFTWVKTFGTSNSEYVNNICIDIYDNIFMAGDYTGSLDIDPGNGTYYLNSLNGLQDAYLIKLDSSGGFKWGYSIGSAVYAETGSAVTTDQFGQVYFCGMFGDSIDFNPGPDTLKLKSKGSRDVFIAKYQNDSKFVWAKKYGGPVIDRAYSIITDQENSIYTAGVFMDSSNFNTENGTYYVKNKNFGAVEMYFHKIEQCLSSIDSQNLVVCNKFVSPSGKYTWTKNGTYYDTLSSFINCDSIIKFKLKVNKSSQATIFITGCNYVVSPSGQYIWSTKGLYRDTISNYLGCDSILVCNVKINLSSNSNFNWSVCDSLLSPSKKYIWRNSGIYSDTIKNKANCDSVMTFNLAIKKRTYALINAVACDVYHSPSGKYKWYSDGSYQDTVLNSVGCDSVLSIQLKVISGSSSVVKLTVCNSFTSPSGKYIWTYSGNFIDTIKNFIGCDSIITFQLNVLRNSNAFIRIKNCDKIISPSGKYTWFQSGTYLDTLISYRGCDSLLEIEATISKSTSKQFQYHLCAGESVILNNKKYSTTGTFFDTLKTKSGCDSVLVISVSVQSPKTILISKYGNVLRCILQADSFQWVECHNGYKKINNQNTDSLYVDKTGEYAVITWNNSCPDTSNCVQFNAVGLLEMSSKTYRDAYPNPSNGIVFLELLTGSVIQLYNTSGVELIQIETMNPEIQLDLSSYNNGVYYLKISNSSGTSIVKLILIKS